MGESRFTPNPDLRVQVEELIDYKLGYKQARAPFGNLDQGVTSPADNRNKIINPSGTSDEKTKAALTAPGDFTVEACLSDQNPDGSFLPYNLLKWTRTDDVRLQAYVIYGSIGVSTVLVTQCDEGDGSIDVDDASIFSSVGYVYIKYGATEDIIPIGSVSSNTLTFKDLYTAHATFPVGSTVVPLELKTKLTGNCEQFSDFNIVGNTLYYYAVGAYSVLNVVEARTAIVSVTSQRDNVAPAVPTGLTADFTGKDLLLKWDKNADLDFKSYELNIYTDDTKATRLKQRYGSATTFVLPFDDNVALSSGAGLGGYGDGSLYCELIAIDHSENRSSGAVLNAVNAAPATPSVAPAVQGFAQNLMVAVTPCPEPDISAYSYWIHVSGAAATELTSSDYRMGFKIPVANVGAPVDVKYRYFDVFNQPSDYSPITTITPEQITFVEINAATFGVDITDDKGSDTATLGGMFDNNKDTDVNIDYGDDAWHWIQYDFHFKFKFDLCAVWASAAASVCFAVSDDGETWEYYSAQADHTLASSTTLSTAADLATAQTNYWTTAAGKNTAKLPALVEHRYWRIYVKKATALKLREVRFDIVEYANRFFGESMFLSDGITIATADNTNNAVKITTTGLKCYTADDNSLYYTSLSSAGLEAYVNSTLRARMGRLAANVYGVWASLGAFGGTGYTDATVFADTGGLTVKDGSSATSVGWIGKNGTVVGAWFKTLGIGGSSYDTALIKADASGNMDISRSVTIGTTDKIISSAEAPGNMLPNGGFEMIKTTGSYGGDSEFIPCWSCGRDDSTGDVQILDRATYADTYFYGGQYSAWLKGSTASRSYITSSYVPIRTGVKYQLSFYALAAASPSITLTAYILWYTKAKAYLSATTIHNTTVATSMTRYTGSGTAPANAAYAVVQFITSTVASSVNGVYIDSVQLERGEQATAYQEPTALDTLLPEGFAYDESGQLVYSSGIVNRIGDIGGLPTGSGAAVYAAGTMGMWNKGTFCFLNSAGQRMFSADGLTGEAYVSNTILMGFLAAAVQDTIQSPGNTTPNSPHSDHFAISSTHDTGWMNHADIVAAANHLWYTFGTVGGVWAPTSGASLAIYHGLGYPPFVVLQTRVREVSASPDYYATVENGVSSVPVDNDYIFVPDVIGWYSGALLLEQRVKIMLFREGGVW